MFGAIRKIPTTCPHCGFVQNEPRALQSTFCRGCGDHYSTAAAPANAAATWVTISRSNPGPRRQVECGACGERHQASAHIAPPASAQRAGQKPIWPTSASRATSLAPSIPADRFTSHRLATSILRMSAAPTLTSKAASRGASIAPARSGFAAKASAALGSRPTRWSLIEDPTSASPSRSAPKRFSFAAKSRPTSSAPARSVSGATAYSTATSTPAPSSSTKAVPTKGPSKSRPPSSTIIPEPAPSTRPN